MKNILSAILIATLTSVSATASAQTSSDTGIASDASDKTVMITASYDDDGVLLHVDIKQISSSDIKAVNVTNRYKVFYWNSIAGMISARVIDPEYSLTINGKTYHTNMNVSELGVPDETVPSAFGFTWYVYGSDTYSDFFAAGIADGRVVALASSGKGFEYYGYTAGNVINSVPEPESRHLVADGNDNNMIHGVFLLDPSCERRFDMSAEACAGESKMNFHFTNAFRVYHGLDPLIWSEEAATAARLHSEDMSANNYFEHDSLDGAKFYERMERQGIGVSGCAENISAGRYLGFDTYNGWVNSAGHRGNMLGRYKYLGVGGAYDPGSDYGAYFTQDYFG